MSLFRHMSQNTTVCKDKFYHRDSNKSVYHVTKPSWNMVKRNSYTKSIMSYVLVLHEEFKMCIAFSKTIKNFLCILLTRLNISCDEQSRSLTSQRVKTDSFWTRLNQVTANFCPGLAQVTWEKWTSPCNEGGGRIWDVVMLVKSVNHKLFTGLSFPTFGYRTWK